MWFDISPRYRDRQHAGEELAELIHRDLIGAAPASASEPGSGLAVLAAPRGGVAVAVPVARRLDSPLDIVLARKLPAPGNPELGFGALGEGGVRVIDEDLVRLLGLSSAKIDEIAARVEREIEERARIYRRAREALPLDGLTAVVVDDGVATGVTMAAAIGSARYRGAARVIAAAPVCSAEAKERLEGVADRFIAPLVDPAFVGVGAYYEEFPQLTDDEVVAALRVYGR